MAHVGEVKIKVSVEIEHKERQRYALYALLEGLGYEASAEALYAAPGFLTIPRSRIDTRDGREELMAEVFQEFLDEKVGVIIIQDGKPLGEVVDETRGERAEYRALRGYA